MKFQTKIVLFIIGAFGLISSTTAVCKTPQCFDCTLCNRDCTQLRQDCDTDCIAKVREFLCTMEVENCIKIQGCDVPSIDILLYPAINYDVSKKAWKSTTIRARKNCCYRLKDLYNNTLSSLKTNGACVRLYDGADCSGESIQFDSNTSPACLQWIDCPERLNAGGISFNDKASSFELC